MAKIISCPNCSFEQKKYTTTIENYLIACIKCNYRWVISTSIDIAEIRPATNVNKLSTFVKYPPYKKNTSKSFRSNNNQVEEKDVSLKDITLDLKNLKTYNPTTVSMQGYENFKQNHQRKEGLSLNSSINLSLNVKRSETNIVYNHKPPSHEVISPNSQQYKRNVNIPYESNYAYKPVDYKSVKNKILKDNLSQKKRLPPKTLNIKEIDLEKYKNNYKSSLKEKHIPDNFYTEKLPYNMGFSSKDNYTHKEIVATSQDSFINSKLPPKEEAVKFVEKRQEFTYSKDNLNRIRKDIEDYNLFSPQEEDNYLDKKPFNTKKYEDLFDDVLHNQKETIDKRSTGKFSLANPNKSKHTKKIEDINILGNARIKAKMHSLNYKELNQALLDDHKKENELLSKEVSYIDPIQKTLREIYISNDLDENLSKSEIRKKNKVFNLNSLEKKPYKEVWEDFKTKYFSFSGPKQILHLVLYASLIVLVLFGLQYSKFFQFEEQPTKIRLPENISVNNIPTIDDSTVTSIIKPSGAAKIPLVIDNFETSKNISEEKFQIMKDNEDRKTLTMNKSELLDYLKGGETITEIQDFSKNTKNTSIINTVFNYVNGFALSTKHTGVNLFSDVKVSKTKLAWLNSLGGSVLEAKVTLTNKTKKTYTIKDLEIIFTDASGKVLNKRILVSNRFIRSLENVNLIIKVQDAPMGTSKAYIFIKNMV